MARNAKLVKQAARELGRYVEFLLAPTTWHYTAAPPADSVKPRPGAWTCMFALMGQVQSGKPAALTAKAPGCIGAANYLGFNGVPAIAAALYLAGREKLKKDAGLAAAFYNEVKPPRAREACLVFSRLDALPDDTEIEVVNLWVGAASLAILHTLANYDRAANDNVIMPFSSGCQSIWTLPYKEKGKELPKAVAGSLDPTVRRFLPAETLSFSASAERFLEMCANIEGSFMAP
ncbi:MAG: DUF169 domain-containing protein [Thermoleophilia bacterium]